MWFGDLSQIDREHINSRVVGQNGVTLPSSFDDMDIYFVCTYNIKQHSISAAHFKQYVEKTHLSVENNHLPPSHTVIIEANINSFRRS
jgi:hypothetical protein